MILNQTIVSDLARLHLDFILCDDSLHIPLLLDVPDGFLTGTRGRENRHTQDPNIISITDLILVQGNLGRNRLET